MPSAYSTFPTTQDRNNLDADLGFNFIPNKNITIQTVGRYFGANTGNHKILIWQYGSTSAPVATATILAASASDGNGYKWATISASLVGGTRYLILSNEANGGDAWDNLHSMTGVLNTADMAMGGYNYGTVINGYPGNIDLSSGQAFSSPTFTYQLPSTVVNRRSTSGRAATRTASRS